MNAILQMDAVSRDFSIPSQRFFGRRRTLRAVSEACVEIVEGETLGVVGESGCGKSTLGRLALGLLAPTEGTVRFRGAAMTAAPGSAAWRRMRASMQMVFQNPYGALNLRRSVSAQILEVLETHGVGAPADRAERIAALLRQVGLAPEMAERYPHQMSGGQLQRVVIARALAVDPVFLVFDESVAALDVSIQAQVINLLQDLQEERRLTYLFISHDLNVVRHICDRVMIMYLGRIVEIALTESLFAAPRHPYSIGLMDAAPRPDPTARGVRRLIEGEPPSPLDPPSGCVFRTRCPRATALCAAEIPQLRDAGPAQQVACHHAHM